jgi:hypothetical protein
VSTRANPVALKRAVLGPPRATGELHETLLSKKLALPIFASDPLSSVAYATEAALVVLLAASASSAGVVIPITLVIALVMAIVVASYTQTVQAYETSGGAYVVARENLGKLPSLVGAAARSASRSPARSCSPRSRSSSPIRPSRATSSPCPAEQEQVADGLEHNAEVMTNTELDELLEGQPADVQEEILDINTDARPIALQIALLIPLGAALLGVLTAFRMTRLPDPEPSAAAESVLGG